MNTQYKALIITILASLLLVGCDHGSRQAFAELHVLMQRNAGAFRYGTAIALRRRRLAEATRSRFRVGEIDQRSVIRHRARGHTSSSAGASRSCFNAFRYCAPTAPSTTR